MKFSPSYVLLGCLACATTHASESLVVAKDAPPRTRVRELEMVLQTDDLRSVRQRLDSLVDALHLEIKESNAEGSYSLQADKSVRMKLQGSDEDVDALLRNLRKKTQVVREEAKTLSTNDVLAGMEQERAFLLRQKVSWDGEWKRRQEGKSEKIEEAWNQLQELERKIFEKDQQIAEEQIRARGSVLDLQIRQQSSTPTESAQGMFRFVNMPGVEFTTLWIENPKQGVSADRYQGGAVRYMFTRGKSWILLGALQAEKSQTRGAVNDSLYSDIFVYGFGSDFYPRTFGRGQRRWLNLYSGFSVGGLFLSSRTGNNHIPFVAPEIGMEWLKTDRFLFDTRGWYLVPMDKGVHLNLRGIALSTAAQLAF